MAEIDDSIFGADYSSNGGVTATGDIELIEGLANAKQNIRNQLLTRKGMYPSVDTDWGSEIYQVLGEDFAVESLDALKIYVDNAMKDNPRVKNVLSIDPVVTVDKRIVVMLNVELVNGTEESFSVEFGGLE